MSTLDWLVLGGTLAAIVGYGTYKTRGIKNVGAYLRGGEDSRWYTVGLSIMATQASAITFLSTPGQGFEDGLGFVQFYFGVPIAMVFLSATMVPIFYRTRVLTAYEYLEQRFDLKTRQLTAVIFLLQRGLGTGLSIYAPAIVLSVVLGWPTHVTTVAIGLVVIAYTVSGGTRAVNQTQQLQMVVMLAGMALAVAVIIRQLPVSLGEAVAVAGVLGKLQAVDYSLRLDTRYTFWSGITGGTFVALAYFGTDQSQVQRYLSGESLAQTRLGMLMNALLKVPMQLLILAVGVFVFVFFQFNPSPVFWNRAALERARPAIVPLEQQHEALFAEKQALLQRWRAGEAVQPELAALETKDRAVRADARKVVAKADPLVSTKDSDYVFLTFVMTRFPPGLVGLLLAVILCAAMSATASAMNALGTTTMVDFYKRSFAPAVPNDRALRLTRWFTAAWGLIAIAFALVASRLDNLIQAVNILGSIFYGPMLGVFLVGFFTKRVRGTPAFVAVLAAQALVIAVFAASDIGFLWYNVIGCAAVVVIALAIDAITPRRPEQTPPAPASAS
ncbi:MAG: sodium:solute symporter [Myxococcaceae bacterium]|nr:sodium:solute symporter [Myxococcaceae bacterium]